MGIQTNFTSHPIPSWQEFADQMGVEYVHRKKWNVHALRLKSGQWEVLFDMIYREEGGDYTRIRIPFMNQGQLLFKLYRETLLSKIGKLFHMQDIVIGDEVFDKDFIIQGNDEEKVKQFLDVEELKSSLEAHLKQFSRLLIEIQTFSDDVFESNAFPDGVNQLYLECQGILESKDELLALFNLSRTLMERLVESGVTSHEAPDFSLEV